VQQHHGSGAVVVVLLLELRGTRSMISMKSLPTVGLRNNRANLRRSMGTISSLRIFFFVRVLCDKRQEGGIHLLMVALLCDPGLAVLLMSFESFSLVVLAPASLPH